MNLTQKTIVIIGALLVAATTAFAPYQYHGYNEIDRLVNGDGVADRGKYSGTGIIHAPLWATVTRESIGTLPGQAPDPAHPNSGWLTIDGVHLDAGRLGLWWAGIALAVAAGVLLTATPHTVGTEDL